MRTPILYALLFVVLFANVANAAPAIDKAGADALKPRIADTLSNFQTMLKQYGYTLKTQGDLMVEPAGTYYAITSPVLSLTMGGNITRNIGMIAINAIPTDNPDILKVAVALPTPMVDKDMAGKTVGGISIGGQNVNGLWHLAAMSFVGLNASYKNVVVNDGLYGTQTTLPDVMMSVQFADNGQNLWSGPAETIATNVTHKDKDTTYTIGNIRMKSMVDKLDIMTRRKLQQDIEKNVKPVATPATLQDILADHLTKFADGANSAITIDNIAMVQKDAAGTPQTTSIKSVVFRGDITGLTSPAANAAWDGSVTGITSSNPASAKFLPTMILAKGSAKGLPMEELLKAKDKAGQLAAMSKAGTTINIDRMTLDAPAFGIDAKGALKAVNNRNTGNMNLSLRGLGDLLAWAAGPDTPKIAGASVIPPAFIAVLSVVQMTGKPTTDQQGRAILTYDFQYGADGKMTLNGADLSAMTQAMGGTKSPAPKAPKP